MKFGVVVFPGTWSDKDCQRALGPVLDQETVSIWHQDTDLQGCDAIILPGGFSYGDYLRAGAIARFAPVMGAIKDFADRGGVVLGICNGFQILLEAGLLPGAMLRNESLEFRCVWTHLRVENNDTPFTRLCPPGQVIRIPISHGEGNYFADADTLKRLEDRGQVAFRYCSANGTVDGPLGHAANPNGSIRNIAGVFNETKTVMGLMPHPENAVEPLFGGCDGKALFEGLVEALS